LFTDPAENIQTRYNDAENLYEVYVHYERLNRQLDEWVPRDRVMLKKLEITDPQWASNSNHDDFDRKLTGNQKRRHDEKQRS